MAVLNRFIEAGGVGAKKMFNLRQKPLHRKKKFI